MADRPILFSGPMVRAILDCRKTQTRRVLHEQPPEWASLCQQPSMLNVLYQWVPSGLWTWSEPEQDPPRALRRWPVDAKSQPYWLDPRFRVGDRLWVRESWRAHRLLDFVPPREIGEGEDIWREADRPGPGSLWPAGVVAGKLRPGIHMPRWMSRLTLNVTDVRVERLQQITLGDICAEGLARSIYDFKPATKCFDAWRELWDGLNASRGAGWKANPWVVALTFDVIKGNIGALPDREAA